MVHAGRADLRMGDHIRVVQKGNFYYIPADDPRGDTCVGGEAFVMLDVFYPVHEDFLAELKEQRKCRWKGRNPRGVMRLEQSTGIRAPLLSVPQRP